jgi:phage tail-like protein
MAVYRDRPYAGFNFLVDLADQPDLSGPLAGFAEVVGLGVSVSVIEYRNGNDRSNAPRKLPGLARPGEIRLRRGVIGSLSLFAWIEAAVTGKPAAYRTVTIQMKNEDQSATVLTWKLTNAIPVSYHGPTFAAGTSAVAIEELVLTCQSMSME